MPSGSSVEKRTGGEGNADPSVSDIAPAEKGFTPYDERHMAVYLALLFAVSEGISDQEIGRTILFIDPTAEPERFRATMTNHLARARWLAANPAYLLGSAAASA